MINNLHYLFADAVFGFPLSNMETCSYLQNKGFMLFNGNQYNPDWRWDRKKLEALTTEQLKMLYEGLSMELPIESLVR